MALILGIETATTICSVALVKDGTLIAIRESVGTQQHSATLTGYISELFIETGFSLGQIDAVAVSMGPGSYTGLRIGVSSAKGLCYALGKPLIAVNTLKSLAWQAVNYCNQQGLDTTDVLFAPMIDARRMEVFTAIYDNKLETIEPVNAMVVTGDSFNSFAGKKIICFGDGAAKCTPLFEGNENIAFPEGISLSAEAVCKIAEYDFANAYFADVAYCEPFYLKEFIAGKPRVKGLYD